MGTKKKGPSELELYQQAQAAQARANQAAQAAATPDPLETRRREYVTNLDKWRMGESGPIDVRAMPGSGVGISLFNEAKQIRDAGRIGRGFASLSDGVNPNYAAKLGQEMDMERSTQASGMLEDYVDKTLSGLDQEMYGLAGMGNARSMNLAELFRGMANDAYGNYMQFRQTRRPSFLKQLGLSLAQGAGAAGMGLLTGGLSSLGGNAFANVGGGPYSSVPGTPLFDSIFRKRGGPVKRGLAYIGGEEGLELEVDKDGNVRPVGANGPEVRVPDAHAVVVPADETRELLKTGGRYNPTADSPSLNPADAARVDRAVGEPASTLAPFVGKRLAGLLSLGGSESGDVVAPPAPPYNPEQGTQAGVSLAGPRYNPTPPFVDSATPPRRGPTYDFSQEPSTAPAPQRMPVYNDAQFRPTATLEEIYRLGGGDEPEKVAASANVSVDRVGEILDHLDELERTPAKDKNGRFKSFLIGLLNGIGSAARQQMQSGNMSLGAVLGGGLGGGLQGGVINPAWDEQLARHAEIERTKGRLDNALKIENVRATIAQRQTKTMPKAQTPAQMVAELNNRLKLTGGVVKPDDARTQELIRLTGIVVAPKKAGGGRGYVLSPGQGVAFPDGRGGMKIIMPTDEEGNPAPVMSASQLAQIDAEMRRLEIQLGQFNLSRARAGQPPVTFDDWLAAGAPAVAQPTSAPRHGPSYNPQAAPSAPASVDPGAGGGQPAPSSTPRPTLVPTGEAAPALPRGGRRRSSGGGSSRSSAGGDSIGQSIADNRALELVSQFEAAKRRGHMDEARGIANEIKNNPHLRDAYEVGEDAQGNPYVKRRAQRAHATINRVPRGQFRSAVREVMQDYGVGASQARRWLEAFGYSPEQR